MLTTGPVMGGIWWRRHESTRTTVLRVESVAGESEDLYEWWRVYRRRWSMNGLARLQHVDKGRCRLRGGSQKVNVVD